MAVCGMRLLASATLLSPALLLLLLLPGRVEGAPIPAIASRRVDIEMNPSHLDASVMDRLFARHAAGHRLSHYMPAGPEHDIERMSESMPPGVRIEHVPASAGPEPEPMPRGHERPLTVRPHMEPSRQVRAADDQLEADAAERTHAHTSALFAAA